jgi:hypothetical protein
MTNAWRDSQSAYCLFPYNRLMYLLMHSAGVHGCHLLYHVGSASFFGVIMDIGSETGQATISSLSATPIAFWIIWIIERNCRVLSPPANLSDQSKDETVLHCDSATNGMLQ